MSPSFPLRRFWLIAAALWLAAPFTVRAAESAAQEEIVSLPRLMVEETARPLQWRYLELPGLEILSVCDDSTAMNLLRRYHRLEELLSVVLPARFCATSAVPEAHILFNEETGRARSPEVIGEMLKKEGVRTGPNGTVIRGPGEEASPFGRAQRIRFLPNMRLWDTDATTVFSILQEGSDSLRSFTFAPDRIAFLTERRTPVLPDWFAEGSVGLYLRTTLGDDDVMIDTATWTSAAESAALARDPERPRTLLPMQELLSRPRPKTADDGELDRVWRAQCALFVRWAVTEQKGARKEALWKFVDRLEKEPPTEALFREHFGMGFADARDRLSDYLPVAVKTKVSLPGPKKTSLPRVKFRAATDLEVARIRGRWERMEIAYVRKHYPALADKYVEQTRRTLHRIYDRGERDPQLLAELGLTEIDAGNPEGAREFLEAAVRAKTPRSRVYFELARLRYQAVQGVADASVKISADDARHVLAPLLAGRLIQPPLPDAYSLMGDVWARSSVPLTNDDLAVLNEGVRLFPTVPVVMLRAIYCNATNGQPATALAFIDTAVRTTRDPAMRKRFENLRDELPSLRQ